MGYPLPGNDNSSYPNPPYPVEQQASDDHRNEQLNLIASFIVTINAFFKGIEDSYRKCQHLSKMGIRCDGPEMSLEPPKNMTGGNDSALGEGGEGGEGEEGANPPNPQKQKSLMDTAAQAAANIYADPDKQKYLINTGKTMGKNALEFASKPEVQNSIGQMFNNGMDFLKKAAKPQPTGLSKGIVNESTTTSTGNSGAITVSPTGLIGVDEDGPLPIGSALVSMAFNVISAGAAASMSRFLQEITGTGEDGKVIEIEQLNNLLSEYAERLKEIANNPKLLKQIQEVARLKSETSVVQTKVTLDAVEGIMAALLSFFGNFMDTAANTGIQLLEDLVEEEIEMVPGANVLVALFSAMQSAGNLIAETIGSGTTATEEIALESQQFAEAMGQQRQYTERKRKEIEGGGSYKKQKFIHELNLKDDIYSKILILESQDMTMENIINLKKMLKLYNSDFIQSEKCNKDYLFGILYGNRLAEPIINFYKYKLNQYKPKKKNKTLKRY